MGAQLPKQLATGALLSHKFTIFVRKLRLEIQKIREQFFPLACHD